VKPDEPMHLAPHCCLRSIAIGRARWNAQRGTLEPPGTGSVHWAAKSPRH
jgi:hypothetical protein